MIQNNSKKNSAVSSYWDARFSEEGYAYGEEPNEFLRASCASMQAGDAISLCEGEGRNAVYLARLGFRVTAVDFSQIGLEKTQALAARHGVSVNYILADMADFDLGQARWDLVVSVFAQPPSAIRQRLYRQLGQSLRPNGALVLESKADTDASSEGRYPSLAILREEIAPLALQFGEEKEHQLNEGRYHSGIQRTVQILAVNRATTA
jgi:SAM-dependent methyltransferase